MSQPGGGPGGSPLPVDSLGLWSGALALPELVGALGTSETLRSSVPRPARDGAVVLVAPGAAPEALLELVASSAPLAVTVAHTLPLPAYVGPSSVVVALGEASGGEVAAASEAAGAAVVRLASPSSPPGNDVILAVAHGALLLEALGCFVGARPALEEAASVLARRRDELAGGHGAAADAARRIGRTFPLVYGSGIAAAAARHWKYRVNERAKAPAMWAAIEDAADHEVAGWGQHGDVTRQLLTLVTLRHGGEGAATATQFDRLVQLLDEVMADHVEVVAEGTGDLARFCDLAYLGDAAALCLAGAEGIDPGPQPAVDTMSRP